MEAPAEPVFAKGKAEMTFAGMGTQLEWFTESIKEVDVQIELGRGGQSDVGLIEHKGELERGQAELVNLVRKESENRGVSWP